MEKNQEVFNMDASTKEVTIIHKDGLDAREPIAVTISGNIDSPFNWLDQRIVRLDVIDLPVNKHMVRQNEAHVLIDREKMSVNLVLHENCPFLKGYVSGSLEMHPDFIKWKINSGKTWEHKELSDFIKMNRSCFEDKATAMKLSMELADVKIKAETAIEKSDDNRGNARQLVAQRVIESNVPVNFKLKVPIFKGTQIAVVEVEVWVNASSYAVTLVSPEANDIISDVRDSIIDKQKEKIIDLAPELVIIEQ